MVKELTLLGAFMAGTLGLVAIAQDAESKNTACPDIVQAEQAQVKTCTPGHP